MSEDELTTVELLEKIQTSVQELLAYNWKVDSRAERLLKIFDDSVKLRSKIQAKKQRQEPSVKKVLESTITDLQDQKAEFTQWQLILDSRQQGHAEYEQSIIESISTLFSSIYDIKQLEYIIRANQKKEEMIQMLKNIFNGLKKQIRTEEQKMDEGNKQIHIRQQRILSNIQEDIIKKVDQKKKQSQKLEIETETFLVLESEKRDEYYQVLNTLNDQKIQRILSFQEDASLFSESSRNQTKIEAPKIEEETKAELKFEVVKLEASYYYEKMAGIGLFILTLILLASFILR